MKSIRLPAALLLILVLTSCTGAAFRRSDGGHGPDVLRLRSAALARAGGPRLVAFR